LIQIVTRELPNSIQYP